MKSNKNQIFRTSGILGVLILSFVSGLVVLWPWGLNKTSVEVERARQKAEVIAYQIAQIYKEATNDSQQNDAPIQKRGLASVKENRSVKAGGVLAEFKNQGNMGIDPWGHAYQYRIVLINQSPRLVVWSLGPNGQLDNENLMGEDGPGALAALKKGDDIRVLLALEQPVSN